MSNHNKEEVQENKNTLKVYESEIPWVSYVALFKYIKVILLRKDGASDKGHSKYKFQGPTKEDNLPGFCPEFLSGGRN